MLHTKYQVSRHCGCGLTHCHRLDTLGRSLTRKEARELTHDPKTYQISELKMAISINIFSVCLVAYVCLFLCFNSNKFVLNRS